MAVRPRPVGRLDLGRDRTLGGATGSAGTGSAGSSRSWCRWTFPGEETGGIEAEFDSDGGPDALHVESVETDGSPRDFYATTAVVVGPDLELREVELVQVAPGVYEAPLGELDPGAYALRVTQTGPARRRSDGRWGWSRRPPPSTACSAPNEPLLAALRARPAAAIVASADRPWDHDLRTTSRYTDLWPLLLVLALLLWPLDVALRRVSVGRRELVAARGWVRRRVAPTVGCRTADGHRPEPARRA